MVRALTASLIVALLQATHPGPSLTPVLTRDIDKRSLSKVALSELSPVMRSTVQQIVDKKPRPEAYTLSRIPVAPPDHKLFLLEQTGPDVCSLNGPNCPETVFDETPQGVVTVADWSGVGAAVVRRPHLQMPDIATQEQLGHLLPTRRCTASTREGGRSISVRTLQSPTRPTRIQNGSLTSPAIHPRIDTRSMLAMYREWSR